MSLPKNWTTSLRYRPYNLWSNDYLKMLEDKLQESKWKSVYHIQPHTGLLNDPNGFSYYNGKWHLFYQSFPYGPVHGVKSWYHMTSDNLVDWERNDYAILPDSIYDSHGVYSGSALPVDDKLFIMYTGNVRNENWERSSYQLGAWMDNEMHIEKMKKPLIAQPPSGYTQEFRDPQVFRYENKYLMIIGTQTSEEKGAVLVYQSEHLDNWEHLGELHYTDEEMGFMVECPNLVFIDKQPVLLFCPQGLDPQITSYQNIYPNMYVTGDEFNKDTLSIINPSKLNNLDEGFDIYASQAFNAPDGRALSVGWIGLPEVDYPNFNEGWAHCLSIVKELTIKSGELYQQPIKELEGLRKDHVRLAPSTSASNGLLLSPDNNVYELKLDLDASMSGTITLFSDRHHTDGLKLIFDANYATISMDRSQVGIPFGSKYGSIRTTTLQKNKHLQLQIFVDNSVCEVFINGGYRVMTSRVFLDNINQTNIFIEGFNNNYTGDFWTLRKANE